MMSVVNEKLHRDRSGRIVEGVMEEKRPVLGLLNNWGKGGERGHRPRS